LIGVYGGLRRLHSRWQLWLRSVAGWMAQQPGHCTAPIPRRTMADSLLALCLRRCWKSCQLSAPRQRYPRAPPLHTGKWQVTGRGRWRFSGWLLARHDIGGEGRPGACRGRWVGIWGGVGCHGPSGLTGCRVGQRMDSAGRVVRRGGAVATSVGCPVMGPVLCCVGGAGVAGEALACGESGSICMVGFRDVEARAVTWKPTCLLSR
jgi:hypothetical protein